MKNSSEKKKVFLFKYKDNYIVILILFLLIFHFGLNLCARTISFASDEFIPLAIAARLSGLNWLNARKMNYYYGYVTLLFFIPLFKIPFIYKNTFLLTQMLLGINSLFHVIAATLLYKSLNLMSGSDNKKQSFFITLISTCCLQVFNCGFGVQIESLFCLCYMVVFYRLVKMIHKYESVFDSIIIAIFTGIAIINNSRGVVLLISIVIILFSRLLYSKKNIKNLGLFALIIVFVMCVHKYLISPEYMKFFIKGAANTDTSSFANKMKLVLTDVEYFISFIKTVIGGIWAINVSTFGFFIISIIAICRQIVVVVKNRAYQYGIIPLFILLNIIGILVLGGIATVVSANRMFNMAEGDRADFIIYTRYFASIISITMAYGLYAWISDKVLQVRKHKIFFLYFIYLLGNVFQVFVGEKLNGFRYGVNNMVFPSLILQNFQDSYRYGFVISKRFLLLNIIMLFCSIMIIFLMKKKELLLQVLAVLSICICIAYAFIVVKGRSDYYTTMFDDEIIEYCTNCDGETIFVSQDAPTVQVRIPDKKVYYQLDGQDILIISPKEVEKVDQTLYQKIIATSSWLVFEKTYN